MNDLETSPYLRMITASGITRHPGGLSATKMLLGKTELTEHSRVLDIGCGAGHTSAYVAKTYGCHVFGVDCSPSALDNARAMYKDEPYFPKMKFEQGDITCLPFSDGYFDVVLCESVLLFVQEKALGLGEMYRVLKPGGFLALNELCLDARSSTSAVKKYFARSELMAHLCSQEDLLGIFHERRFGIIIQDEQSLDIIRQLKSDLAQFFTMKSLLHMMEFFYSAITDIHVRQDILTLLKYGKDYPQGALDQLRTLAVLAQK